MALIDKINDGFKQLATLIKGKVNKTDVIAVEQGGTGATDLTQARKNIGTIEYASTLPVTPEANKFYAVRNSGNIDLYMSDTTGTLLYKFTTSQQTIYTLSMSGVISQLFSASKLGFAYDFNDLSTLYQDAAGTVAVTGAGQPVGKVLDKSGNGNHATQSTSSKRPMLQQNTTTGAYYLQFDGVDDFLKTSNIDLSTVNQFSLFSGVRKMHDNPQIITEFSYNGYATTGGFYLVAGEDAGGIGYTVASNSSMQPRAFTFVAPDDAVLSVTFNMISKISTIRRNAITGINGSTGNGNFGNHPLYIGSRTGTAGNFNGHLYSLIGVARLANDSEIVNVEKIIAKNVGVTL